MRSLLTFVVEVLAFAIFIPTFGTAQNDTQLARLRIAPSKHNYVSGEAVLVTYRITNLSSSLLCFPPPSIDCHSVAGVLRATATAPKGVAGPKNSWGCIADPAMDRDAGYDIDQHWIKLGPLQSYEIRKESHSIGLTAPGLWTVEAAYVPMQANAQSRYQNALRERGCSSVPELHSSKVTISVKP
ncbi:MAG TPA: hypothetical protein VK788_06980 [Terriglobales bacterium]|jgi:hypothetical protein|nr:hypothetical protein [Terriglobales bacterium]